MIFLYNNKYLLFFILSSLISNQLIATEPITSKTIKDDIALIKENITNIWHNIKTYCLTKITKVDKSENELPKNDQKQGTTPKTQLIESRKPSTPIAQNTRENLKQIFNIPQG